MATKKYKVRNEEEDCELQCFLDATEDYDYDNIWEDCKQ